jgi:homoserine kinase
MIEPASRSSKEGWCTAFAPATIANFGSGFDAFAAAFAVIAASEGRSHDGRGHAAHSGGRHRRSAMRRSRSSDERGSRSNEELRPIGDLVSVRRAKHPGVRVVAISGDEGRLPRSAARNTAAVAAAAVLREAHAPFGLDLILEKGLPLASGLGSSAASAAAGAYAAALALASEGATMSVRSRGPDRPAGRGESAAFDGEVSAAAERRRSHASHRSVRGGAASKEIDKSGLIAPALKGEHVADGSWHGDNVWASLMGGGVIVISTVPPEIVPLESPPELRWVTVHPQFELSTRRARAVLPKKVALSDAAAQAGCFASFVTAWRDGDRRGIGRGLQDRLAEPHRARLIPGYAVVRRAALRAGAYGLTLAGAGPSVLAVTPEGEEERIGEAMRGAFRRAGLDSTMLICAVDPEGARVVS